MSKDSSRAPTEKDPLLQKKNSVDEKFDEVDGIIAETKDEEKSSTLVVAFFLMLVFQLGNRIFGRLETFPMHNYPLFMNMLSTVIYIPICFAYIIPVQLFTKTITKEQTEIPKYKFGVMGIYDSLAGIMQTFAVNFITNSSMIVLVQQSAIPISMAISKIALKAQYTTAQYLGAAVVLFGIFLVLLPNFSGGHAHGAEPAMSTYELLWIFVLMVSCVPMCLSSVYKEQALGETEIDIMYLNGWVAVFQTLFAIPLCLPSAQVINIAFSEIIPNMYGGAMCLVGINSITNKADGLNDACEMAPLYVSLYLAFNVVYNILIVVILKHGSANILWMASTVIVPLSDIAFSLKFMPGSRPLHFMDLVGLVVIMFGLVVYRFTPMIIDLVGRLTGRLDEDKLEEEKLSRQLSKKAERKQTKYVGLNQIEALQTLIDSRIVKEMSKKSLYRTPGQIRGNLLVKLGIPPSPMIAMAQVTPLQGRRGSPLPDNHRPLKRYPSEIKSRGRGISSENLASKV